MRLRAGLDVLWRCAGETQVGTDPRCAVVLQRLTPAEQRLLEHLRHEPTPADLLRAARTLQVEPDRAEELVELVRRAGVLRPGPDERTGWRPRQVPPDEAYWERLLPDGDGAGHLRRRAASVVAVQGLDRLGVAVATQLAAAGVGTVLVEDDRTVVPADLGAFTLRDVGRPRGERARVLLRGSFPHLRTTAPPRTRPDVLVPVTAHVTDPVRMRPLLREDVTHLPVVVGDVETTVGPLVTPGTGPCTRCLDLHRTDADPAWPAVATQLRVAPAVGTESAVAHLAAAVTVHQVLARLDGRDVAVTGATLELSALDPIPALRRWTAHPSCGCQDPPVPPALPVPPDVAAPPVQPDVAAPPVPPEATAGAPA